LPPNIPILTRLCRPDGYDMVMQRHLHAQEAGMSQEPHTDPELVKVFDTDQESEAMVIQSLLASAGIESLVSSLEAQQDILPGVGGVIVSVNPAQADDARNIIEDYKNTPAVEPDDASEPAPE
jgi:Putative prokaryotic signal transducing protein